MILVTRPQPFCYHLKSLLSFGIPFFSKESIFFSPLLEPIYYPSPSFEGTVIITSGQALFSCGHLTHNPLWCIGQDMARFARRSFKNVSHAVDVFDLFKHLCQQDKKTKFLYIRGDKISWPLDVHLQKKGYHVTSFMGYSLKERHLDFTPGVMPVYVTCYSQRLMHNFLKQNVPWQSGAIALCLSQRIAEHAGNGWGGILLKKNICPTQKILDQSQSI